MAAQRKYPEELRERAVKMVSEIREQDGKGHGELWTGLDGGKSLLARYPELLWENGRDRSRIDQLHFTHG